MMTLSVLQEKLASRKALRRSINEAMHHLCTYLDPEGVNTIHFEAVDSHAHFTALEDTVSRIRSNLDCASRRGNKELRQDMAVLMGVLKRLEIFITRLRFKVNRLCNRPAYTYFQCGHYICPTCLDSCPG
jgi:hypothetical protein